MFRRSSPHVFLAMGLRISRGPQARKEHAMSAKNEASKMIHAVKQVGMRAVRVVERAAGDGPWTEDAVLRAAGWLETGAKDGGLQRPWPNLAARLRNLVATRGTKATPESPSDAEPATDTIVPTTPPARATKTKGKKATPEAIATPAAPTTRDVAIGGIELAEIVERFLKHLEKTGKSRGTVFSYSLDLGVAERHFGANCDVTTITADEVAEYFESAAVTKNRSGGPKNEITIKKLRRTLRLALVWAAETGLLAAAPIPVTAKVPEAADVEQVEN